MQILWVCIYASFPQSNRENELSYCNLSQGLLSTLGTHHDILVWINYVLTFDLATWPFDLFLPWPALQSCVPWQSWLVLMAWSSSVRDSCGTSLVKWKNLRSDWWLMMNHTLLLSADAELFGNFFSQNCMSKSYIWLWKYCVCHPFNLTLIKLIFLPVFRYWLNL